MQRYYCTHEDGNFKHCQDRDLKQCKYCSIHKPEPVISDERRRHLDHENDEIDLVKKPILNLVQEDDFWVNAWPSTRRL